MLEYIIGMYRLYRCMIARCCAFTVWKSSSPNRCARLHHTDAVNRHDGDGAKPVAGRVGLGVDTNGRNSIMWLKQ